MRKFETIIKDITRAKLTVAKDRTTLKFPETMPEAERQKIEILALKIHEENPSVEFTLRGVFSEVGIKLSTNTSNPEMWEKFGKTYSY